MKNKLRDKIQRILKEIYTTDEIFNAMANSDVAITSLGGVKFSVSIDGEKRIWRQTKEQCEEAINKIRPFLPNAEFTINIEESPKFFK